MLDMVQTIKKGEEIMRISEVIEGALIGVGATRLLELTGLFNLNEDMKSQIAFALVIGYFAWGYIMVGRYKREGR